MDNYVEKCVLIVKAKTEVASDDKLTFRVLETWKGSYDPRDFVRTTEDGRFFASQHEHGVDVTDGQEVVFFFTRENQPVPGKLSSHSTAFPVRNGRITYAATSDGLREIFAVDEFKRQIWDLVEGVEVEIVSARKIRGRVGDWVCLEGVSEPEWCPGGRRVVFTRNLSEYVEGRGIWPGRQEIWMASADGSDTTCLAEGQKLFWSEPNVLAYSYGIETGQEVRMHFAAIDLRMNDRKELPGKPTIPIVSFEWSGQVYSIPNTKMRAERTADEGLRDFYGRFSDQCHRLGLRLGDLEVRSGVVLVTRSWIRPDGAGSNIACLVSDDLGQAKLIVRDASQPAISPDGHRLAFVRNGSLWVRKIEERLPMAESSRRK